MLTCDSRHLAIRLAALIGIGLATAVAGTPSASPAPAGPANEPNAASQDKLARHLGGGGPNYDLPDLFTVPSSGRATDSFAYQDSGDIQLQHTESHERSGHDPGHERSGHDPGHAGANKASLSQALQQKHTPATAADLYSTHQQVQPHKQHVHHKAKNYEVDKDNEYKWRPLTFHSDNSVYSIPGGYHYYPVYHDRYFHNHHHHQHHQQHDYDPHTHYHHHVPPPPPPPPTYLGALPPSLPPSPPSSIYQHLPSGQPHYYRANLVSHAPQHVNGHLDYRPEHHRHHYSPLHDTYHHDYSQLHRPQHLHKYGGHYSGAVHHSALSRNEQKSHTEQDDTAIYRSK